MRQANSPPPNVPGPGELGWLRRIAAAATLAALAGCAAVPGKFDPNVPVSQAELPSAVQPYAQIDDALACIRASGVLRPYTFVVGPFADSTGKINSVATGATGAFVPQGGSASYVTDAIRKAGGRAISTYFGAPAVHAPAQYAINGIFNSLDFGTELQTDLRIAGVGPVSQFGWAQLTLSMQLDEAGSRLNRQMSMIQRPVRYSQVGGSGGLLAGSTLLTGSVTAESQERLQFEALNGPIALGVVDVLLKEFPVAARRCRAPVANLLDPATDAPPSGETSAPPAPADAGSKAL